VDTKNYSNMNQIKLITAMQLAHTLQSLYNDKN